MSTAPAPLDPRLAVVEQLRQRVAAMETGPARLPVPTLPALADLVPLHAGASYSVDSATLALALAAGASEAGEWVGFAGWRDFGAEAARVLRHLHRRRGHVMSELIRHLPTSGTVSPAEAIDFSGPRLR